MATSVQNSTLEEIAYSLFMKQTVANTSLHVHFDIRHWLLINTKGAIYRKTVKRLKKVSKFIEKMMGLKKILVLTVCGLI